MPFATYLFYRLPHERTGKGGETTPDEIVEHTQALVARHGFRSHKLKGGVFHPDHHVEMMHALADAFPKDGLRRDPNAAWSVELAIRVGKAIEGLNNDYFEDPTWGLEGTHKAGTALETFQYGASVHSSGELGIQLASMLHWARRCPISALLPMRTTTTWSTT